MPSVLPLVVSLPAVLSFGGLGGPGGSLQGGEVDEGGFFRSTPWVPPPTRHVATPADAEDVRVLVRRGQLATVEVVRLAAHETTAATMIDDYVSRDEPIVLTGALPHEVDLDPFYDAAKSLAPEAVGQWDREPPASRAARSWITERVRAYWPQLGSGGRLRWHLQSTSDARRLWGCRSGRVQCSIALWEIRSPLGVEAGGARSSPHAGAEVHVDGHCLPAWSLQLRGSKTWTFLRRRARAEPSPFGTGFRNASEAVVARVHPGELLVWANGWVPHSTESNESSSSVHGVLVWPLEQMVPALFGPDAFRRRCGDATPCVLGAYTHAYCGAEILALNPGMVVEDTAVVEMPSLAFNLRQKFAKRIGRDEASLGRVV
jgi:hypothetical protein